MQFTSISSSNQAETLRWPADIECGGHAVVGQETKRLVNTVSRWDGESPTQVMQGN